MTIKNITLNNFKFHHYLSFPINNNCLIYGENGTGKSSIYEALYSLFYTQRKVDKNSDIREKYKNREYKDEKLEVEIDFDDNTKIIREDNTIENIGILSQSNIFCANERVLNSLVDNDFYTVINDILIEHFPALKELLLFKSLEREIQRGDIVNRKEIGNQINIQNIEFKKLFNEYIPLSEINNILQEEFQEDIQINFHIEDAMMDEDMFHYPEITLIINSVNHNNDLHNHFNEAKLKLIGISIYLSLVKKYTTPSSLNLLILLKQLSIKMKQII